MKKVKLQKLALSLVTLFLLSVCSSNIFGQQIFDKESEKNPQIAKIEIKSAAPSSPLAENHLVFFPSQFAFPKANVFPPAKKQTNATYVYPNKDERFKKYLKRTFGPYALLGSVATATFAQITDEPEEWENNSKGFGRRLASSAGRNIISQTVIYGLDESFRLDSNYYKSSSKKFKDRLKNAFLSTFTARKPDGKRVFGFPRIAGIYTSSIIANQFWYPSRFDYKDGIRSGTISLGTSVSINFVRELF